MVSGADVERRAAGDRLADVAEALAAQQARRRRPGTMIGIVRPNSRSDGMCRWSMWTWESSTTSGTPTAATSTGWWRRRWATRSGQRRIGEHLHAGHVDQHAGVADPRDRRAGGRARLVGPGDTTRGSVGLRAGTPPGYIRPSYGWPGRRSGDRRRSMPKHRATPGTGRRRCAVDARRRLLRRRRRRLADCQSTTPATETGESAAPSDTEAGGEAEETPAPSRQRRARS